MIITLTGSSCAGKTCIAKSLREKIPGTRFIISVTTRLPREGDNEGEYQYVSEEEFRRLENQHLFLWTTRVRNFRYGTFKKTVDEANVPGFTGIMILVPEKVTELREYLKDAPTEIVTSFYISTQPTILEERLKNRGLTPTEIAAELELGETIKNAVLGSKNYITIKNDGHLEASVGTILGYLGM